MNNAGTKALGNAVNADVVERIAAALVVAGPGPAGLGAVTGRSARGANDS